MLVTNIIRYLESHKRLVVPQLGAFIVKERGQVLFTELLKRDDGVLRNLLRDEGLNELEAAGEIDRFVFEIRHAAEHGREYPIEGFGTMKPGTNGTIAFVYAPRKTEPAPTNTEKQQAPTTTPGPEPDARRAAVPAARVPASPLHPEPCLKGLRYGKPPKNTNTYTYVGSAPRKRRTDRFVWIAAIAAVIALAAIAFGYFREAQDKRQEAAPVEKAAPQPADGALRVQPASALPENAAATPETPQSAPNE